MGAEDSCRSRHGNLDGEGLDHLIERRAVPFLEKFSYIVQLYRALQHHEWLGSSTLTANVVVKRDGTIRVVDFELPAR